VSETLESVGTRSRRQLAAAVCVMTMAVALGACSSGPFGTSGQRTYAAELNETMANNSLLSIRFPGATANAKLVVRGAIAGPGPANPAQTAQVDRTWVFRDPPPDIIQVIVTRVVGEGVTLSDVYCEANGQTLLVGRQYLAPFTVGFIGNVAPGTGIGGHGQEATLQIETVSDIPTSTPDPLTGVTAPTAPTDGATPTFGTNCPGAVIGAVETALG